jgi:drug/metabolite transporter (DMT)-like permease
LQNLIFPLSLKQKNKEKPVNYQTIKYELLLLLTAAIWGFAFVAQRIGMDYIGPYLFNGIRFALGSLVLLPLLYRKRKTLTDTFTLKKIVPGLILGVILFTAAACQQIGMVSTSAGKAGFITALYVVLVPIFGLLIGKKVNKFITTGVLLSVIGLYFLCINKEDFSISNGDLIVLIGAVIWAIHVLFIDHYSGKIDPLLFSFQQFVICSILSFITSFFTETWSMQSVTAAAIPLAYGGFLSVGIAYTLQVVAQKFVHPAPAAVILSLESVFAVIGGWLVLSEKMSIRSFGGCALILAGVIICQLGESGKK